jgi:hypothetical protein
LHEHICQVGPYKAGRTSDESFHDKSNPPVYAGGVAIGMMDVGGAIRDKGTLWIGHTDAPSPDSTT